ncbi:hypothetical protein BACFIN_08719 [Bacteroides finegoldii DSM 17565]|nr:hypothetical protein BACFIN_08719 [Bacteroides finegoldii DSM 17565]
MAIVIFFATIFIGLLYYFTTILLYYKYTILFYYYIISLPIFY